MGEKEKIEEQVHMRREMHKSGEGDQGNWLVRGSKMKGGMGTVERGKI